MEVNRFSPSIKDTSVALINKRRRTKMDHEQFVQTKVLPAMDQYFRTANKNDHNYNRHIIKDRKYIDDYGDSLIDIGHALAVFQLQQFYSQFNLSPLQIATIGKERMFYMLSIIMEFESRKKDSAVNKLVQMLKYTDEDVISLAALQLSNKDHIRLTTVPHLKSAYKNAEGTGCQIALAQALEAHDDDKSPAEYFALTFGIRSKDDATNFILLDSASKGRELSAIHPQWRRKQYHDGLHIFLCHSSHDKPLVRKLYQQLKSDGFDPWLDEEDLLAGQEWKQVITKAVRRADVVIACLSRGSVNKAGYVQKEIKEALDVADEQPEGTIFLIPLKLEECEVPDRLSKWQWVNYFDDNGYKRLVDALHSRIRAR